MADEPPGKTGWRQVLWMVAIWAMSVAGFAATVYGFRALLPPKPAAAQVQQGQLQPVTGLQRDASLRRGPGAAPLA